MEIIKLESVADKSDNSVYLKMMLRVFFALVIAFCLGKLFVYSGIASDPSGIPILIFVILSINAYFYSHSMFESSEMGVVIKENHKQITKLTESFSNTFFEILSCKISDDCLNLEFKIDEDIITHVVSKWSSSSSLEPLTCTRVKFPLAFYSMGKDNCSAILEIGDEAILD